MTHLSSVAQQRDASERPNYERGSILTELMQETSRNLVYIVGSVYLALQFLLGVFGSDEIAMPVLSLAPILAVSAAVTLYLLPRRLLLAQVLWLGGLAALVTAALVLFRQPEIAYLYALLPFVAAITMGGIAGLAAQVFISLLVLVLTRSGASPLLDQGRLFPVLAAGVLAGLIGWASSRTLYTVAGWSLHSFVQAQQNLEEARRRRAQLAQVLQDLDRAYYRLERTNAALMAAWRAAAQVEQFKTQFAASLSHELRTPLNLIVGFAEMMLTAPHKYEGIEIPRPYRRDLDAIYRNAHHLEALIDDVLDLARLDAGKLTLALEEGEITALIREVVDMVRDYVEAKGLDLKIRAAPGLPKLRIDRLRVRQVLLNLLVNAARFTETGGISVEAIGQEGGVLVRVSDTGRGIPESEQTRIFEEFHQGGAPSIATGWAGGTGLGLPISRRLVELHGGRMGVESAYLKGTTFWFTLPGLADVAPVVAAAPVLRSLPPQCLRAERRLVVVVHNDSRFVDLLQHYLENYRLVAAHSFDEGLALALESQAIALIGDLPGVLPPIPTSIYGDLICIRCTLPSSNELARVLGAQDVLIKPVSSAELWCAIERLDRPIRRVLIADDEPDMVRLIRQMLVPRIAPEDCYEAYNGEDALAILRARAPDLLLLDLMMPRLNGHQVLAKIAQDPALASTRVIIVSAKEHDEIDLHLSAAFAVAKGEGIRLGELARILDANLSAMAPGWR